MFKVNEYYNGNVVSIGFSVKDEKATAGVMAKGEYEFSTNTEEIMIVTCGEMNVLLPGKKEFELFVAGTQFVVNADSKFLVKLSSDASYICLYK